MIKIYSVQIMSGVGFLRELIINGITTDWAVIFATLFFLITLYNTIAEISNELSKSPEDKR